MGGDHRERPAPLQQGELDGLCGLYAIINALRWALGAAGDFGRSQVDHLFGRLLDELEREAGGIAAVSLGIHDRPLVALARASGRLLAEDLGLAVRVSQPFRSRRPSTATDLARAIRTATEHDRAAFLIGLKGRYRHWTVCVGATRHHLVLFDSADIHRLRISCCRLEHQRRRAAGRVEHELNLGTILKFRPVRVPRPTKGSRVP